MSAKKGTHNNKYTYTAGCIDEIPSLLKLKSTFPNFPNPDEDLIPGVKWGCSSQLYTPAYWKVQYHLHAMDSPNINHQLGHNILEEIVACLLGGHGIPSQMGLLAFNRMKEEQLIKSNTCFEEICNALMQPFFYQGKYVKYRFPKQKAKFISELLNRDDLTQIPLLNDLNLRKWLLTVNGIGPKTASWITRNWLNSENVAIIDIHIYRAGVLAGFFSHNENITTGYFELEEKFLYFCDILDVKPSCMDALIWVQMKESNRIALNTLRNH